MAKFLYSPNPNRVPKFFDKIQSTGKPAKVTAKYLKGLGFKSANDYYVIGILKALGFVDPAGVPTERWQAYRDKAQARAVLASSIRDAYPELFELYPDAYRKDDEALRNFFSSHSGVGDATVTYMLHTFKGLCTLADFEGVSTIDAREQRKDLANHETEQKRIVRTSTAGAVTINVNVQLQLPATDDGAIYDRLFESLKKHILS